MTAALDWILNGTRIYPTSDGLQLVCGMGCPHVVKLAAGVTVREQIREAWHVCLRRDDAVDAVMARLEASMEAKPVGGGR